MPKYVAYPFRWGACCKELIAGNKFPAAFRMNQYRYANFSYQPIAGSPMPLQNTEPVSSGKLLAMIVNGLSDLGSKRPVDRKKPHIFALAAETVFFAI
jgi:hypothetical protein